MKKAKKCEERLEAGLCREIQANGFSKIIAAVSGGADSVALASLLASCDKVETIVAHCNFHLRGEESMRDERFVRDLCAGLGLRLATIDFNVGEYMAAHKGTSVEMACRRLRYDWFASLMEETGADRIATGHNADDNIETLLLNLLRGSGTSGLKGMLADNGRIWRPLLRTHRCEIVDYLKARNLGHITDSSNLSSDYRRNFLRNEVIPLLKTRWSGFDKALDRSVRLVGEDNRIVSHFIIEAVPDGKDSLEVADILAFPSPESLVRRFIEPVGPFTTTASEIIAAIRAQKPHARLWKLMRGTVTLRNRRLTRTSG